MNKIFGLIESCTMLLLGAFGLWLSSSDKYLLLMNENFRWLTAIGSALVLILGIALLSNSSKRTYQNTAFFGLLILVVLLGKPYLNNNKNPESKFMQTGLWEQIDLELYPKMELRNISTLEADKVFETNNSFTTVGIVKRLEALDGQSSFAFMSTFMYCCVADMFGTGFRVPTDQLKDFEDGQLVMISGKLIKENTNIELPNFRVGMATISSTNKDYYLQAENIMTFNPIDQLPNLSDLLLEGDKTQSFAKALQETGLLKDLESSGSYTLFVPVDDAISKLETPLNELSKRKLKRFLRSHIVKGKIFSKDLMKQEQLKNLNRTSLNIDNSSRKLKVNESRVLFKDTEAKNGVIHYIYPAIVE